MLLATSKGICLEAFHTDIDALAAADSVAPTSEKCQDDNGNLQAATECMSAGIPHPSFIEDRTWVLRFRHISAAPRSLTDAPVHGSYHSPHDHQLWAHTAPRPTVMGWGSRAVTSDHGHPVQQPLPLRRPRLT